MESDNLLKVDNRSPREILLESEKKQFRRYLQKVGTLTVTDGTLVYKSDWKERIAKYGNSQIENELVQQIKLTYAILARSRDAIEDILGASVDDRRHANLKKIIMDGSELASFLYQMVNVLGDAENYQTLDRDLETLKEMTYLYGIKVDKFRSGQSISDDREYLTSVNPRV